MRFQGLENASLAFDGSFRRGYLIMDWCHPSKCRTTALVVAVLVWLKWVPTVPDASCMPEDAAQRRH